MSEVSNIFYLPAPKELTLEQTAHWVQVLENADRLRENALRMLGRLPIEAGIDEEQR